MLIVGLIIAACLYALLYWVYLYAESHFTTLPGFLSYLNHLLFVPENNVFFILRGLLLITFFYVLADTLLSPARRGLFNARKRRADAEHDKKAFRGVKTVQPPPDDDFATHY